MERYKKKFVENAQIKIKFYIDFYKEIYQKYMHFESKLNSIKHKIIALTDVKESLPGAILDLYFEDQKNPEKNEYIANSLIKELNEVGIPTLEKKWTHGDGNKVSVRINAIK